MIRYILPLALLALCAAAPRAEIESIHTISQRPQYYHGWPTLARLKNGDLLIGYSGGREGHICPFGQVEVMRSSDDARTWSYPQVIFDGPIDDRDAGVLQTDKGTILVTTMSSQFYNEYVLDKVHANKVNMVDWPSERIARWDAANSRLPTREAHRAAQQNWVLRSTDGGNTWSAPIRCPLNSPHGPIQLKDGRILYPGKTLFQNPEKLGVCQSTDDGLSWQWITDLPLRKGDDPKHLHELHAVECNSGKIILHIRNENNLNHGETLQSESTDGGRTWTVPHSIGVWGMPSQLLKLRDGRLLMSYGYRRKPYGNQARLSNDEGKTWSEPMTISDDGVLADLGYPSTVELPDGTLLTAWYEERGGNFANKTKWEHNRGRAILRLARWKLAE